MSRIDFTPLSWFPKAVIIVHSKEHMAQIDKAMRGQYPKLMEPWRVGELEGARELEEYSEKNPICIAPHIYDNDMHLLQVATADYWEHRGYDFVDFDILIREDMDFGDIIDKKKDVNELLYG